MDTTGSPVLDVTPTGTLNFTDTDTGDAHTVAITLASTSGPTIPAVTQADLATALTTTLHVPPAPAAWTGTSLLRTGIWIFLRAGQTLTVNYNVGVRDASISASQTVSVTVVGVTNAVAMTSGPEAASVAEQANTTGSSTRTRRTQASASPTPTLAIPIRSAWP